MIKGNIGSGGDRIFHTPESGFYSRTQIDEESGERWFCTVEEALGAGWRAPQTAGAPTETPSASPSPTATGTSAPTPVPQATATNTSVPATSTTVPQATATNTSVPATSTAVPQATATNTSVPATSTTVPQATATNTSVPATSTTVPQATATNTSVPATSTTVPQATATNTSVPATSTPIPQATAINTSVPAAPTATAVTAGTPDVQITNIFFDGEVKQTEADEYVEIANLGGASQDLSGWKLVDTSDVTPEFEFSQYLLEPGARIRVYTNEAHPEWGGFSFGRGTAVWSNCEPDTAGLFDDGGNLVSSMSYPQGPRC